MQLAEIHIQKLISNGEGIAVEFKTAHSKLNKDVYDSICAFLNREGGDLLLGVNDKSEVVGVDETCVQKIMDEIITQCNNPQKINPRVRLTQTISHHFLKTL